jgi:hypothetical protein
MMRAMMQRDADFIHLPRLPLFAVVETFKACR